MKRKLYENLLYWKNNKIKMPYMLIGARQTGKTYILTEFCKAEFENFVYINLDNMEDIRQIFEQTINPTEIIKNIEALLGIYINYVAENLYSKYKELYYWALGSEYEVDFLINVNGDIIPIEVKASDNTTSKSLNYYIKRYNPKYAIRLSTKNFGEANGIKSIPLYASFLI